MMNTKNRRNFLPKLGGDVSFSYISATERDKHFEEVRKMARNKVI